MRDITIKRVKNEDGFQVRPIQDDQDLPSVEPLDNETMEEADDELMAAVAQIQDVPAPLSNERLAPAMEQREPEIPEDPEPKDFVKVKFSKFVQLVSARDCREVVKQNDEEEVVISSNLLTELASAHDSREERKMPVVFLVGLAIGVVLTYILFTK